MNTYDWIENPYRTETFVLKFKDQDSFQAFWQEYIFDETCPNCNELNHPNDSEQHPEWLVDKSGNLV